VTSKLIIWYGELVSRPKILRRGTLFMGWGLIWLLVFLVLPCIGIVLLAFASRGSYGEVIWDWTGGNFKRLIGFGVFGWSADTLWILAQTTWMALVTTVFSLVLAYPLAFFIASRSKRSRYLWLLLLIIPQCTNLVIRTYAWMLILAPQSPLSKLAQLVGYIPPGQALYPSAFAVYLGMVSSALPFAVLPLYTNVERLDWSLVDAASDLYASRWGTFVHAIVPQTVPGLSVAVILTFVPSMGMFVVPDLLGGAKTMLVGNLIQQQFGPSRDWPFGAAVSLGLMALTLVGVMLYRKADTGGGERF
jgi:spermidine/putrescine transport system permease protein